MSAGRRVHPEIMEQAVKTEASGCKQKDDVQSRDEVFPQTYRRRDNHKIVTEQEEQGPLGERLFHPRRWEGSEK